MFLRTALKFSATALIVVILNGCANSASHKVLKQEHVGDAFLTCSEIRRERRKAQVVIRGVEQDKEDMTGADIVDGILWFPFNVIAKQSNYSSATNAAEARIDNLMLLEEKNGCRSGLAKKINTENVDVQIVNQLRQLSSLYKSGVLTKEEYITKKMALLEAIDVEGNQQSGIAGTRLPVQSKGTYFIQALRFAKSRECRNVLFVSARYNTDVYRADCPNGAITIRCKWGDCTTTD